LTNLTQSSAHKGPFALVDGRSCHLLNQYLGKERIRIRGKDPQFDDALLAIYRAGLEYVESSCRGTFVAAKPEPATQSTRQVNNTVSTTTAAEVLGITDRAVRKAITEKRLKATKLDGRYRIDRDDLTNYLGAQT
jgi:excisionase family DNA binding protein